MNSHKPGLHIFLGTLIVALAGTLYARNTPLTSAPPKARDFTPYPYPQQEQDPLQRPRTKKQEEAAKREKMSAPLRQFLAEVDAIITDEERQAFKKLGTNAERTQFVEDFWGRRNPNRESESDVNEYKEEFYRRLAYANEHFGAGIAGSRTDRGRIYIKYGKPDTIDSHPAGGPYLRTAAEGGGQTETYPFEIWRYRHLEDAGQEVEIEFVDRCGCGAYQISINPDEKDAMANVPGAGLKDGESLGLFTKAQRLAGRSQNLFGNHNDEFSKIEQLAVLNAPPKINYAEPDTVAKVSTNYLYHSRYLPFDVRVDFLRDAGTVVMPITVQVPLRELTFVNKDGVQRGVVSITGRLRKLSGPPVQSFEDVVRKDIPTELLERELNNVALYWKALPMRPGRYRLDIVLKDMNGDKTGVFSRSFVVPEYGDETLSNSSLILADLIEPLPQREIGTGSFVIGPERVRPRVPPSDGQPVSFRQEQKLNLWMQVYNLGLDSQTHRPSARVRYEIVDTVTGESVVDFTTSTQEMGNIGGQMTLEKSLPLNKLGPGSYQVTIRVDDLVSRQTISPTAKFTVH